MRIRKLQDIDRQKLEKLFEKRGHGITILHFWTSLQKKLKDSNFEIHQCICGEVIFIKKSLLTLFPKDKNENILCKKCGNYEELTKNTSSDFKDLFIIEIFTDMYSSRTDDERKYHFQRAIKEAEGTIPVRNYTEFEIGLAFHLQEKDRKVEFNLKNRWIPLIQSLYDEASKTNPEQVKAWYYFEEIIKSNQKIFKNERIYFNELARLNEIEHYPLKNEEILMLGTFGVVAPEEKKIRLQLSHYRNLYEIALLPDFLMNLINVIEGSNVSLNPFSGKTVTIRGNLRRVKEDYISDKILFLTQCDKIEEELKVLLVKTYNNRIRNDVAHSQYHLDVSSKIFYSTKYDHSYSFEEIENLLNKITEAEYSFNFFKPEFEVVFKDSEAEHIINRLGFYHLECFLDNNLNPSINIFQYFYFNKKGMMPDIAYLIEDDRFIIEIDEMKIIFESEFEYYFLNILTKKKYLKLNLVLIAPVMERYEQYWKKNKHPEIISIDENNFYITSVFEKTIPLTEYIAQLINNLIQ